MNEMTLSSRTGFEIRALAVRGRARYPSVAVAPHNIRCARAFVVTPPGEFVAQPIHVSRLYTD